MDSLDWNGIRPLNGSQAAGFEELCAQLARSESPIDAKFHRKGSPDAGVECFSVLPGGGEWGWQAKYFTAFGAPQMSQLDESVKRALDKHPQLVRYFVCIPIDRPDARLPGQTSALERWKSHVQKWQGWAQDRGMEVEFIWWGSSELIDNLSQSEHIGRLFFWFGKRSFNQDWFQNRLDEAVKAAGPRYTPEVHVDLPIVQNMERFGRSGFLFDEVKSLAIGIREAHDELIFAQRSVEQSAQGTDIDNLSKATSAILDALSELEPSPAGCCRSRT